MTFTMNSAHSNMVWQQVRPNEVSNPEVLKALQQIDRAQFVSDDYKALAYSDTRLPIGCGQFMWTPLEEGRILQFLQLKPSDSVLEVGTGSGFFTALIAQLSLNVISIEYFAEHALKVGGHLVAITGQAPAMHVQRITRTGEWQWQTENLFETVVAPLVHAETKPEFNF